MEAISLDGGFADAPIDAAHAFRAVLNAMARPGVVETIGGAQPPAPLSPAAGSVLLTLCDPEAPVHLAGASDTPAVRDWLAFHTGAPVSTPETAMFALGRWEDLLPLDRLAIGTPEYPDRSATLIVEVPGFDTGQPARLTGPGIADAVDFTLPAIEMFQRNSVLFPLGLDFIFAAGNQVAALPRTSKVEAL
ncbi:MAG: phosphonate C-P lyase system protein PhnH [Pseudomonadota bacterium]